jgi:Family of unknown function (DUF5808)
MRKRKKFFTVRNILLSIVVALYVVAAITEQLRLPSEERTWHGKVGGVPYDFRVPTLERLLATFWNKDESRLFVPKLFGMGWDINFYHLVHPETVQSR